MKVGRAAFDEDAIRCLEDQHPDLEFDWPRILEARPVMSELPDPGAPVRRERREDLRRSGQKLLEPLVAPAALDLDSVSAAEAIEEIEAAERLEPPHPLSDPSVAERLLGAEQLARLRGQHAAVLARINDAYHGSGPARGVAGPGRTAQPGWVGDRDGCQGRTRHARSALVGHSPAAWPQPATSPRRAGPGRLTVAPDRARGRFVKRVENAARPGRNRTARTLYFHHENMHSASWTRGRALCVCVDDAGCTAARTIAQSSAGQTRSPEAGAFLVRDAERRLEDPVPHARRSHYDRRDRSGRHGQFVADLKKEDFEVFEDGVKQEILSVELVHGGRTYNLQAPPAPPPQEGIILPPSRPKNDAAGRIFLFFVDDLHMNFRDTPRIRQLFKKMSTMLVHEGDMFGVVSTGTSSIAIDMTYDRKRMDEAINKISGGALKPSEIIEAPQGSEGPSELRYRAHVAFSTANDIVRNLEKVQNRRKAVIYVSNGYDFNPFEGARFGDPNIIGMKNSNVERMKEYRHRVRSVQPSEQPVRRR